MLTIPSGLQAHSISGACPLSVQGEETPDGTRYGVYHATQGRFILPAIYLAAKADLQLYCLLRDPALRAWVEAKP